MIDNSLQFYKFFIDNQAVIAFLIAMGIICTFIIFMEKMKIKDMAIFLTTVATCCILTVVIIGFRNNETFMTYLIIIGISIVIVVMSVFVWETINYIKAKGFRDVFGTGYKLTNSIRYSILILVLFFVVAGVIVASRYFIESTFAGFLITVFCLVGFSAFTAFYILNLKKRALQSLDDAFAAELYPNKFIDRLKSNIKLEFYLYLRPFSIDGQAFIRIPRQNAWDDMKVIQSIEPLEPALLEAMRPDAPLIAFEKNSVAFGPGRVNVNDDDWKTAFLYLAEKAKAIFIVPANTDGTRWEMEKLRSKCLLQKSFFLIPPTPDPVEKTQLRVRDPQFDETNLINKKKKTMSQIRQDAIDTYECVFSVKLQDEDGEGLMIHNADNGKIWKIGNRIFDSCAIDPRGFRKKVLEFLAESEQKDQPPSSRKERKDDGC